MATTSQLRASYPEFITRWPTSTSQPSCNFAGAVPVVFPAGGSAFPTGRVTLKVHPATRQIWRAVAAVMLHFGYEFVETAGGSLACRKITGGTGTTLHAHGIAADWNPSKNRYRVLGGLIRWFLHTDMPKAMVAAIEAIAMTNGRRCLEWGGRWTNIKDPMHYEVDQLKTNLAPLNLATLPAGAWAKYLTFESSTTTPTGDQMLDRNSPRPSPAVAMFQRDLIDLGYDLGAWTPIQPGLYPPGADGKFGDDAENGTKAFQKDLALAITGKGDALTVATAANLARYGDTASTVDPTARAAAAAANKTATAAAAAAAKANISLDKIRSE